MATDDFLDSAVRLAEDRGWSRAELARRAGFSNSQFNKWRQGTAMPASSVIATARALDMDVVGALMQVDALTPTEVSRYAARQTLADLDLVDLAAEVYERVLSEAGRSGDDGPPAPPGPRPDADPIDGPAADPAVGATHAERVQARRRGRSAAHEPAV